MVQERRDPIPPGFYTLDTQAGTQAKTQKRNEMFRLWVQGVNRNNVERVKVLKSSGNWYLFEVKKDAPRWTKEFSLPFPDVAPYGQRTNYEDTVQRPDAEEDWKSTLSKKASTAIEKTQTWAIPALIVGGVVVGVILSSSLRSNTIRLTAR